MFWFLIKSFPSPWYPPCDYYAVSVERKTESCPLWSRVGICLSYFINVFRIIIFPRYEILSFSYVLTTLSPSPLKPLFPPMKETRTLSFLSTPSCSVQIRTSPRFSLECQNGPTLDYLEITSGWFHSHQSCCLLFS